VKSVLIALHLTPGMKVLDFAGGKGGDLAKWRIGKISHLILADVAEVSGKEKWLAFCSKHVLAF
jgi:hypothetical protein